MSTSIWKDIEVGKYDPQPPIVLFFANVKSKILDFVWFVIFPIAAFTFWPVSVLVYLGILYGLPSLYRNQLMPAIGIPFYVVGLYYLFAVLPFWIDKKLFFWAWYSETFGERVTYLANIPWLYDTVTWLDAFLL